MEVRWYGCVVSDFGVRCDPRSLDGLLTMEPPNTGSELQKLIYALQWVRQGIHQFTELVPPLHEFMEYFYGRGGKRTKRTIFRVLISSTGWGKTDLKAFRASKTSLANQVTIQHRNTYKYLCLYTDRFN